MQLHNAGERENENEYFEVLKDVIKTNKLRVWASIDKRGLFVGNSRCIYMYDKVWNTGSWVKNLFLKT